MKKIELNNSDCDIRWIEDELIGIKSCPICKHFYDEDDGEFLIISIYEDSPKKCSYCGSEFIMSQKIIIYKLEKELDGTNTRTTS